MSEMIIERYIAASGKPALKLTKKQNCVLGRGKNTFVSKETNLFINELKLKSTEDRKFVLSVRHIGSGKNEGDYELAQFHFNKVEILQFADEIKSLAKDIREQDEEKEWLDQYYTHMSKICRDRCPGYEDGFVVDTCRNEDNIPSGCSWGYCTRESCPIMNQMGGK
jgi:hypothetical protein